MTSRNLQNHEMIDVAFDNEYKAGEAQDTLKQLEGMALVDLKSAAVVTRDASDKVEIKETSDFDAKQSAYLLLFPGVRVQGVIPLGRSSGVSTWPAWAVLGL
jgi:hypothetical protein